VKNKTIIFILSLLVIVILVLAGCSAKGTQTSQTTTQSTTPSTVYKWRTSVDTPEDDPLSIAMKKVCDTVREKSGGRLDITPYFNGVLGDYIVMNELVMRGDMEMAWLGLDTSYDPRLAITFYWPYIYSSYQEHKELYKKGGFLYNLANDIVNPMGMKILGVFAQEIMGASFTKVPPEPGNPDVKKQMKIRVMPIQECDTTYKRLGYMPTAVPYAEIYTALQTNLVDGQMGGGLQQAIYFADVTSCYVAYNESINSSDVAVNNKAYNSLPQDLQKILDDAVQEACMARYETVVADDLANEKILKDKGFTIIKLTPEEMSATVNAVRKDVWPALESKVGKAIVEQLYKGLGMK